MADSRIETLLENWAGEDNPILPPISNNERILQNILGIEGVDIEPIQSRVEALLLQILEQGGGSGGVETATVVFTNASTEGFYSIITSFQESSLTVEANSVTVEFPLYDGKYYLWSDCFGNVDWDYEPVCTGSITVDGTDFYISGDGTITLKAMGSE